MATSKSPGKSTKGTPGNSNNGTSKSSATGTKFSSEKNGNENGNGGRSNPGTSSGKTNTNGRVTSKSAIGQNRPQGKEDEGLRKLMMDQLKDIYWAEKALTKALPKMAEKATSQELIDALENHLEETNGQISKLEEVFQLFGEKATAKKCEAMEGLIKEGTEIMEELEEGSLRDAGIICAGQKVEHYEIATYGCLRTYAEILGEMEAAELLGSILEQEVNADETLSEVAKDINWEAAEEVEEEEEA